MTFALGWALACSESFLTELLETEGIQAAGALDTIVRLQEHEEDGGLSDIEIESPRKFFILIEAKRGWMLPTHQQIERYRERHSLGARKESRNLILVITECSRDYAERHMTTDLQGVPVRHTSWREIQEIAMRARNAGRYQEKWLLDELINYLRELLAMQRQESGWVYVVSLGSGTEPGWGISWIDIVAQRRLYFHPVGSGWPKEPVNYLAVRYRGELQSIHHVEGSEIVDDVHGRVPEIPSEKWPPHFLYDLGPPFRPAHRVPTGRIYRAARVWCLLDTLFTSPTIGEAAALTKKRLNPPAQ